MRTGEFLSVPENRTAARSISEQAVAILAPSEASVSRQFVEPALDMVARGESLTPEASDAAMGLGGAELALLVVVPTVVQVLTQLLTRLGEESIEAVKTRSREKETEAWISIQVVDAPAEKRAPERVDLTKLRQNLTTLFSESELHDLCFDLGVDYEGLPGEGKGDKARELVAYFERRGRTLELEHIVKQLRPHISEEGKPGAVREDLSAPDSTAPVQIKITLQGIEGLVGGPRFTRDKRRIQALTSAIKTALVEYLAKQ